MADEIGRTEAAKILNCNVKTLALLVQSGDIEARQDRPGCTWRLSRASVEAFKRGCGVADAAE
jgi:excisionase family DNA binding protein